MSYASPYHWSRSHEEPLAPHKCSTAECPERVWDEDDHKRCESCGLRFCAEHLTVVQSHGLYFCPSCANCTVCGKPAGLLTEAGDLVCGNHPTGIPRPYPCERCSVPLSDRERRYYPGNSVIGQKPMNVCVTCDCALTVEAWELLAKVHRPCSLTVMPMQVASLAEKGDDIPW